MIFASVVTLALNMADPLITGAYGKAAFDAVGPLLLIGWAEVGPGLLQAINTSVAENDSHELTDNGQSAMSAGARSENADERAVSPGTQAGYASAISLGLFVFVLAAAAVSWILVKRRRA